MSLGGPGGATDPSSLAVDKVSALGVTVTVAGGNEGPSNSTIGSPGAARTAITVAASCSQTQMDDPTNNYCYNQKIASFSSRGPVMLGSEDMKKPDVTAPGVSICAARSEGLISGAPTCFDNTHVRISGTSMATPHVAGAAALIKQANPTFTPAMIKAALKDTATNLGVDYNLQGSGLVNVFAAVGKTSTITSNPDILAVTVDPSKKSYTTTQNIALSSIDNAITSISTELVFTAQTGITLSLNNATVTFTNRQSSLSYTATADNDLALPGVYSGSVLLKNGTTLVGLIPIKITVKTPFEISKSNIDFGVDNPSSGSWTSAQVDFTVKNLRTDLAQQIRISSDFDSAISLVIKDSSNATTTNFGLAASETKTLKAQLSVSNNANLQNFVYFGNIIFKNQQDHEQQVKGKLTKYYVITLDNIAGTKVGTEILGQEASIFDKKNGMLYIKSLSAGSNQILLDSPGPYDIGVSQFKLIDWHSYYFFSLYENVVSGSTTSVNLSTTTKNKMSVDFRDENGANITSKMHNQSHGVEYADGSFFYIRMGGGAVEEGNIYLSDMSDRFTYITNGTDRDFQNGLHDFTFSKTGVNSSTVFETKPADYKKTVFNFDFTKHYSAQLAPVYAAPLFDTYMPYWIFNFGSTEPTEKFLAGQKSLNVFSNKPEGYYSYVISNYYKDNSCNENPLSSLDCNTIFTTPYIDFQANKATMDSVSDVFDYPSSNISVGTGPVFWSGRFDNVGSEAAGGEIILRSNMTGTEGNPVAFQRQSNISQPLLPLKYSVSAGSRKIAEGDLPGKGIFNNGGYGYWYQSYLFYKQVTDKGKLSFETADLTYKINGVDAV
ncbi:MAG: S8 family serine peptidase, partial [Candidatus Obscuribacterales bacterium]